MTKRSLGKFAILLVLGILSVGDCALSQTYWFTLVNQSGYTINEMYVRPSRSQEWSDDVLEVDQLHNDEFVDITWSGVKLPQPFDVHIVYEDGETADILGLAPPNEHSSLYVYWDQTTLSRWE